MKKKYKVTNRKNDNWHVGAYDYAGLCHYWAYNSGYKSTASDRMSCNRELMYSWTTVIAKMFDPVTEHGEPLVLIGTDRHSNTTAKQKSILERAISHMNILKVAYPDVHMDEHSRHEKNMEYFFDMAVEASDKYQRARVEHTKNLWINNFNIAVESAKTYASYFKQKRSFHFKNILKLLSPDDDLSSEEILRIEEAASKQRKAKKKRKEKAAKARIAERTQKAKDVLQLWLTKKNGSLRPDSSYIDGVYLRVNGSKIETTEGAVISLKDCIVAFEKYSKGELEENTDISGFRFRGVHNGIAKIGCHNIPIERIEKLLSGFKNDKA